MFLACYQHHTLGTHVFDFVARPWSMRHRRGSWRSLTAGEGHGSLEPHAGACEAARWGFDPRGCHHATGCHRMPPDATGDVLCWSVLITGGWGGWVAELRSTSCLWHMTSLELDALTIFLSVVDAAGFPCWESESMNWSVLESPVFGNTCSIRPARFPWGHLALDFCIGGRCDAPRR